MKRTYLEEDLELVQKYFPGAKTVTLRTPFDLTARGRHRLPRLEAHASFHDADEPRSGWRGGVLWMS